MQFRCRGSRRESAVAQLFSLIWLIFVKQVICLRSEIVHRLSVLPHRELFRVRDRDAMTAVSRLRCVSPPRPESGVITGHGPRRRLSPSRLEDQPKGCLQRRTSVTPDRVPASGSEKVRGRCHVFCFERVLVFFGSPAAVIAPWIRAGRRAAARSLRVPTRLAAGRPA